jgi:hypothetical protein
MDVSGIFAGTTGRVGRKSCPANAGQRIPPLFKLAPPSPIGGMR